MDEHALNAPGDGPHRPGLQLLAAPLLVQAGL